MVLVRWKLLTRYWIKSEAIRSNKREPTAPQYNMVYPCRYLHLHLYLA
jgi:hypothetical protein